MKIEIEIRDKLYKELLDMCNENSITIENYILDCVEDTYNLMKYGDLNEKLYGKKEETPKKEAEEIPKETKKRPGRPKKTEVVETEEKKVVETVVTEEQPIKIKKIRTLKTK